MKLFGGITLIEGGMHTCIRAMNADMKMLDALTENIARFGTTGYQRKIPVKTSFAEYIGPFAVDTITDTTPGRMRATGKPLDLAITTKGYFQVQGKNAVKLTRDGRFQMDKDGYLVTLTNEKVLGSDGEPVKFPVIPGDLKDIKFDQDGTINIYNRSMSKKELIGRIAVASEDGTPVKDVEVSQGYSEESNVLMADEFFALMPIRRTFEGSRQAFILQSDNKNKLIQIIGRSQ